MPKPDFGSGDREGDPSTPKSYFGSGEGGSDLLSKPKSYCSGDREGDSSVPKSDFGSGDGGSDLLSMPKSDFGSVDGEIFPKACFLLEGS